MKNREITYYSLLASENLKHIEDVANKLSPNTFLNLEFDRKWHGHLWIPENNETFLEYLRHKADIEVLHAFLGDQLSLYLNKHLKNMDQSKSENDYTRDWLNHTIFICKDEYTKSGKEIYAEAVKWCESYLNKINQIKNPPLSLEAIFFNKKHLVKLVEELTAKGFCKVENDTLTWTGIEIFAKGKKRGSGYQMVALSELCREYYLKDRQFEVQEICNAWNSYFNTSFARELFSTQPPEKYFNLFKNLINSLRYI